MYKLFKSKKAVAVDDFLYLLLAMAVFVVFILILTVTNFAAKRDVQMDITQAKVNIDANQNLLYFLKTPIADDKNIADLIAESYLNDDFGDFDAKAENYLNELYGSKNWRLELYLPNGKTKALGGSTSIGKNKDTVKIPIAKVQIPLINMDKIAVNLFLLRTTWG